MTTALPRTLAALAEARYCRYREAAARDGVEALAADALPGDAERVLACSAFAARLVERYPALLAELAVSGELERAHPGDASHESPPPARIAHYRQRLDAALGEAPDEPTLLGVLRRERQREWLRIAWRDIGGLATLDDVVGDTSAFADAAIAVSVEHTHRWQAARLGEPRDGDGNPQRLLVLALGKLGAGELNYSSDIDLIFAYPQAGETAGGKRSLSSHEFFLRLGRRLIKSLSERTADGIVFRVDMRLRPFGDSGPLVTSFDALEDYYQTHGRDWERYALIRARPIADEARAGDALLRDLRPFVYRRYLDFGTLESLRAMKRMIGEEVSRQGREDDVKLGPGGIREVEFTGQAFQMVRGGREPRLRERRIQVVLRRLAEMDLLPDYSVKDLLDAYRFLRTAEHRLQQVEDRQVHVLPEDEEARAVIAAGMGFGDWAAFRTALETHRQRVSAQFQQVFGNPDEDEDAGVNDPLTGLWGPDTDAGRAAQALAGAGFTDGEAAAARLRPFLQAYNVRLLDSHGRRRLQRLMPDLLRAVATQADALTTLDRVLQIVEAVARRSVYLSLLAERPIALSQLVKLCAASPWIAHQLGRFPLLLDELLDPRSLYAPLDRTGLEEELDAKLANVPEGDTEQEMEALRQFRHAAVLRVAAADVSRAMPLMVVSDHLTEIAETVLRRVLALGWRDLRARHGEPRYDEAGGERRTAGFAIVAYGKLGGIELGYGSDLDLVFVHGSGTSNAHTDGPRSIDNVVFFQRLGQRIIHLLATRTPAGVLYEVDSRLRPSGSKGPLVNRLPALADYLNEEAWTWELQALVRARVVAGEAALKERFAAIRQELLLAPRDPETLRREVRDMRLRMRRELGTGKRAGFDLKQDPGGIADIEFMVQYCALRWANELGRALEYTDNIRLLEAFSRAGLMDAMDARRLTDAYRALRARVHAQALQEDAGPVDDGEFAAEREAVLDTWHRLMGPDPAPDQVPGPGPDPGREIPARSDNDGDG